jgi:hypothetical protein
MRKCIGTLERLGSLGQQHSSPIRGITHEDKMSDFERMIADTMIDEDGKEWTVGYAGVDWDDEEEYIDFEEDADWDVYGEEEFA